MSAARCAIRMRSKEPDRKKAVKLLERDLINGPRHCFGFHDQCSPDFCLTARGTQCSPGTRPSEEPDNSSTDDDSFLGTCLCVCVCVCVSGVGGEVNNACVYAYWHFHVCVCVCVHVCVCVCVCVPVCNISNIIYMYNIQMSLRHKKGYGQRLW